MITRVDTVLIGKDCPSTYTTVDALNVGDVAIFDENRAIIKTAAAAGEASALYVGVVKSKINVTMPDGSVAQKANVEFSNMIQKGSKPSAVIGEYQAPVEQKVTISLGSANIVAGNRYVIKVLYKDIESAGMQFTHSYEVYAESNTAADLAAAFVAKINKHKNRRVQAALSTADIVLNAMPKDDNEGVNSISEYSVVNMDVTLFTTIPGALLANQPASVPGAVITKVVGTPGKGYWKQVRDVEARMMGYKGHVMTGAYPSVEQARKVQEGVNYDYATIENDNLYLSNDNQYIKTTPMVTELYVTAGKLKASIVAAGIEAFISGSEASKA